MYPPPEPKQSRAVELWIHKVSRETDKRSVAVVLMNDGCGPAVTQQDPAVPVNTAVWRVSQGQEGSCAVMRESIRSSHTATVGEAFAAVTRIRYAVEGAAEDNIAQGLQKIAELSLN